MQFGKIKFVIKPDDVIYSKAKGKAVSQKCVEGQAWCADVGVSQVPPDYRTLGFGKTIADAKKDAVASLHQAHKDFMLQS